jgi:hypothetical protein
MTTKQTTRIIIAALLLSFSFVAALSPIQASALGNNGCETDTSVIKCTNVNEEGGVEQTGLWSILMLVIQILTAGVGVIALAGIVYGSVLYTSAGGSQEQVKKAMTIFTNVVIGVIAYAGMWALLNFLIPGGVFN